ncbi:MAG TPA: MFS transporter [Burkholderiales bacterium]|nr:MFS transporter [Burkholderiales bacterium]
MSSSTRENSSWAPLRRPLYRALWIATLVSSIGTWMHEVGAGWLMVTLNPSPVMVALVQAATALPAFLLSVPAGALADIVDRRRYLIVAQLWMLGCAALLGALTIAGAIGAALLLGLTFALACGAAMMTPAWAATVPELVPREELAAAIALNSTSVNVARAIGPAIAGVLVAAAGPAAAFLVNACSFVGVIAVLARWQRTRRSNEAGEAFFSAMRSGLRYVRAAPRLQAVMVRGLTFFACGSAMWALLPLIARGAGGGARTYGLFLTCIGTGAVCAAVLLAPLRVRWSRDRLVQGASVLLAAMMSVLAYAHTLYVLIPAMLLTGVAWLTVLSSLHVSAQIAVPGWVRARALSVYIVMLSLGMSAGAALWGAIAARTSVSTALVAAASGAVLAVWLTRRFSLGAQDATAVEDTAADSQRGSGLPVSTAHRGIP